MITKECLICGKKFNTYPYYIKKGWGKYCSSRCYGESIRSKHHSPKTEFKKGAMPWCAGKKGNCPQISGKNHHNWKGGKRLVDGYWWIYMPGHLHSQFRKKYVKRATLVMEEKIGRLLKEREIVHHIDGSKENDSPDNLYLMRDRTQHDNYETNVRWAYDKWGIRSFGKFYRKSRN